MTVKDRVRALLETDQPFPELPAGLKFHVDVGYDGRGGSEYSITSKDGGTFYTVGDESPDEAIESLLANYPQKYSMADPAIARWAVRRALDRVR